MKWPSLRSGKHFAALLGLALLIAQPAFAAVFTVNSAGDEKDFTPGDGVAETAAGNGVATLRAALEEANVLAGADRIIFSIEGTLTPATALPALTDPLGCAIDGGGKVTIDGIRMYENGLIEGGVIHERTGLVIASANNTIEGFAIFSMQGGYCIKMHGSEAHDNTIRNCEIGTDGTLVRNQTSIGIDIGNGAYHNLIGGTTPGSGNVISGNFVGIIISDDGMASTHDNVIQGNFIGTDPTGLKPIPNTDGISLYHNNETMIGGIEPGAGNIISGNSLAGIDMIGPNICFGAPSSDLTSKENDKNLALKGRQDSINQDTGPQFVCQIRRNSIFKNGGKGIRRGFGSPNTLPSPRITSRQPLQGTAPANSTVELFADEEDEYRVYLGTVTATAEGTFSSDLDLTPYAAMNITATATDSAGNTAGYNDMWTAACGSWREYQ